MPHRKSITLLVVSFLLVIPLFCEATDTHGTESEDSSSGEADFPRVVHRPGHGASPDEGEGEVSQGQDPAQQSTQSSAAAVGTENNHLPREPDVEEPETGDDVEQDRGVEEDYGVEEHDAEHGDEVSDELTTVLAAPSTASPLAPIPSEEEDVDREDSNSQHPPHNETLIPEPSQTVIIWDGTGEPDRELSSNQPEQSEDKPVSQPGHSNDKPHSEELHGGANGNGNGVSKESGSDEADKSDADVRQQDDRPGAKPVPITSSGSASSSMAWVVVFAVVSSALLISGMSDSESDRDSSCYHGCRHNFNDFNPYAWPPTPVNRNEITLRPIT